MSTEQSSKKFFEQSARYGSVTALSYVFLLSSTYILVEWAGLHATYSYAAALTLTYMGVFFSNSYFVFKVEPTKETMTRFSLTLVGFWLLNNATFIVLHEKLGVQYMIAVVANLVIFGILRFFFQRNFVFKKQNG